MVGVQLRVHLLLALSTSRLSIKIRIHDSRKFESRSSYQVETYYKTFYSYRSLRVLDRSRILALSLYPPCDMQNAEFQYGALSNERAPCTRYFVYEKHLVTIYYM